MISAIPRPEHPRPDFQRDQWLNLNGEWDFALDPKGVGERQKWFGRLQLPGKITVPFPVESEASGQGLRNPPRYIWYMRRFTMPKNFSGKRITLNFGAVDYRARCWLNGHYLGEHRGGYTPFSFEITAHLNGQENCLVVLAEDSRSPLQVRGKQTFLKKNFFVLYTPVTGIWQTVWLEATGDNRIVKAMISPDLPAKKVVFACKLQYLTGKEKLKITVYNNRDEFCAERTVSGSETERLVELSLAEVHPWSPDDPHLYRVEYRLFSNGREVDLVRSYFGIRSLSVEGNKILLNGKPLYQKLLLNQGYYPGGHYTALSDEIIKRDVEMVKEMGYNGVRIHQKIEDKRFLYWCDQIGVLAWAEMPSFYQASVKAREWFREEWEDVLARDYNHPSIIAWVPFNETWGIYDIFWKRSTKEWIRSIVAFTRNFDPTRLLIDNSGFDHIETDVLDIHIYPLLTPTPRRFQKMFARYKTGKMSYTLPERCLNTLFPFLPLVKKPLAPGAVYNGEPVIISEYGGFGFYRSRKDKTLIDNLRDFTRVILDDSWFCGYCYTQQYDTEQEKNGLITFKRKYKIPPEVIRQANSE